MKLLNQLIIIVSFTTVSILGSSEKSADVCKTQPGPAMALVVNKNDAQQKQSKNDRDFLDSHFQDVIREYGVGALEWLQGLKKELTAEQYSALMKHQDNDGQTLIFHALLNDDYASLDFIKMDSDLTHVSQNDETLFNAAILMQDIKKVKKVWGIAGNRIDINQRIELQDEEWTVALYDAIHAYKPEIVEFVLNTCKADISFMQKDDLYERVDKRCKKKLSYLQKMKLAPKQRQGEQYKETHEKILRKADSIKKHLQDAIDRKTRQKLSAISMMHIRHKREQITKNAQEALAKIKADRVKKEEENAQARQQKEQDQANLKEIAALYIHLRLPAQDCSSFTSQRIFTHLSKLRQQKANIEAADKSEAVRARQQEETNDAHKKELIGLIKELNNHLHLNNEDYGLCSFEQLQEIFLMRNKQKEDKDLQENTSYPSSNRSHALQTPEQRRIELQHRQQKRFSKLHKNKKNSSQVRIDTRKHDSAKESRIKPQRLSSTPSAPGQNSRDEAQIKREMQIPLQAPHLAQPSSSPLLIQKPRIKNRLPLFVHLATGRGINEMPLL